MRKELERQLNTSHGESLLIHRATSRPAQSQPKPSHDRKRAIPLARLCIVRGQHASPRGHGYRQYVISNLYIVRQSYHPEVDGLYLAVNSDERNARALPYLEFFNAPLSLSPYRKK